MEVLLKQLFVWAVPQTTKTNRKEENKGCEENMKKNRKKIFGIGTTVLFVLVAFMPVISAAISSAVTPRPATTTQPTTQSTSKPTKQPTTPTPPRVVVETDPATGDVYIYVDTDGDGYYEQVTVLYKNGPPYVVIYTDDDHDGKAEMAQGDFDGDGINEIIKDCDGDGYYDTLWKQQPDGSWIQSGDIPFTPQEIIINDFNPQRLVTRLIGQPPTTPPTTPPTPWSPPTPPPVPPGTRAGDGDIRTPPKMFPLVP